MKDLPTRIRDADHLLAPYAIPIEGTLGREFDEAPDASRFPFQRDRDRIIHSRSFRRLKGKTQVFVEGQGDHYRTRLTHTMEVAQISRDMARTLALNEDLAECIALAHDLGHPPFGHAGEEALDAWMKRHGSIFEHNAQSLRIVTMLDRHSSLHTGLNLNIEVLEGLRKHRTPHDHPREVTSRKPSLEAQLVNIADEIAYTGHDCEDGLRARLFTTDHLGEIPLVREALEAASARGTSVRGALIHMLVTDLYAETEKQLGAQKIHTLEAVYENAEDPVRFSVALRVKLDALRSFLWDRMYMHPDVRKHAEEGMRIVTDLCDALIEQPNEKVREMAERFECPLTDAVKDYVAGMTDEYAKVEVKKLHE